jgi:hypothetical protein
VSEQESCQPGIVRMLAGDLKAVYQIEPAIHDIGSLVKQREPSAGSGRVATAQNSTRT